MIWDFSLLILGVLGGVNQMTSWQLLEDYFWGCKQLHAAWKLKSYMWEKQWHTWSSRNWEKVICEKNNGILRSWLYAWAILSNETAQNVRSAELVFFLSNLRLLEGMGLALRPKAISRNTIYICYNFQNEIIFQKDRKNRPIKNVFRFWISDCIKLKYSSVNNIIMESKLL